MKNYLLLLLALLVIGCGDDREEMDLETPENLLQTRKGAAKIFPLALGSQWIYELRTVDTSTNFLRPFKVDTFKIIKDTIINQATWFKIDGLGRDIGYAVNWEDGFYYARAGEKPFLFAKFPSEVGDTFTSMIGEVKAQNTVVATGLEIKVPAGTFYCHKYRQVVGPQKMTTNYYFAPGVGLVMMEIMDRSGQYPVADNRLMEIVRK